MTTPLTRRPDLSITGFEVADIRFPTSRFLDGSDAMHPDPNYSAAYVILRTDDPDGVSGHGFTFTIGRGNDLCVAAVEHLARKVVGLQLGDIVSDMAAFWRTLAHDSQLRWLGPEKGVVHMATAAVVNAVWDLWAKMEQVPVWKLLCSLSPAELVRCIDFSYISDAITPSEAIELLARLEGTRPDRERELLAIGYPAYTTSAGWLGYDDAKVTRLIEAALSDGFEALKMKVGRDLDADARRAALFRSALGPDRRLMMDANQAWDVDQAVAAMERLARYDPWWIEEPTSPDDVLGHATIRRAVAPIRVATGEHAHNRVMFKQFLQANAIDVCQIDACRMGGLNEVLAVLLLAAKFGIPVCPHAGGVGLCELVQHIAVFDFVCVSGTLDDRMVEFADHLHEHFVTPARVHRGRYIVPTAPGYSAEMQVGSRERFSYPDGPVWFEARAASLPPEEALDPR
jgi:L-fuconate dehydratase